MKRKPIDWKFFDRELFTHISLLAAVVLLPIVGALQHAFPALTWLGGAYLALLVLWAALAAYIDMRTGYWKLRSMTTVVWLMLVLLQAVRLLA